MNKNKRRALVALLLALSLLPVQAFATGDDLYYVEGPSVDGSSADLDAVVDGEETTLTASGGDAGLRTEGGDVVNTTVNNDNPVVDIVPDTPWEFGDPDDTPIEITPALVFNANTDLVAENVFYRVDDPTYLVRFTMGPNADGDTEFRNIDLPACSVALPDRPSSISLLPGLVFAGWTTDRGKTVLQPGETVRIEGRTIFTPIFTATEDFRSSLHIEATPDVLPAGGHVTLNVDIPSGLGAPTVTCDKPLDGKIGFYDGVYAADLPNVPGVYTFTLTLMGVSNSCTVTVGGAESDTLTTTITATQEKLTAIPDRAVPAGTPTHTLSFYTDLYDFAEGKVHEGNIVLPGVFGTVQKGLIFEGWTTDWDKVTDADAAIKAGTTVPFTEDTAYFAVWSLGSDFSLGLKATPSTLDKGGVVSLTVDAKEMLGVPTISCDKMTLTDDNVFIPGNGQWDITLPDTPGVYMFQAALLNRVESCMVTVGKLDQTTVVEVVVDGTEEIVTVDPIIPGDGKVWVVSVAEDRSGPVTVEFPTATAFPAGTVVKVVAEDGTETVLRKVAPDADGVIRVEVSEDVNLKIVDDGKTFSDIKPGHWAEDSIAFVSAHELFNGANGKFDPNGKMSRSMLALVLHNMENNPASAAAVRFSDVADGKWYSNAARWAFENKIISGYPDGRFGINDPITRETLAVMLHNYAGKPDGTGDLTAFPDGDKTASYAQEAMRWMVGEGLLTGRNGQLSPKTPASRAEVASILMRYLQ